MLLSVVSLALMTLVGRHDQDEQFWGAWKNIQPSVVRIYRAGERIGTGVMIDPSGYFIARQPIRQGEPLTGETSSGKFFPLTRVSEDSASGLVLLESPTAMVSGILAAQVVPHAIHKGDPVLIVLADSVESGQVTNPDRLGVMTAKNRLIPLAEYNLESATPALAGAPVFNYRGELVGLLNANLATGAYPRRVIRVAVRFVEREPRQQPGTYLVSPQVRNYGPASLTVAYSLGPDWLRRVITGFLSPSHEVQHPWIGVFVRDSLSGGAYVDAVEPESPAFDAGMRRGDVIFKLGEYAIPNQMAYARVLLLQEVGRQVKIGFFRDGEPITTMLTVSRARG